MSRSRRRTGALHAELIRPTDPGHRSLRRFFRAELAEPLGLQFHTGLLPEVPEERLARVRHPGAARAGLRATGTRHPSSRRGFRGSELLLARLPEARPETSFGSSERAFGAPGAGGPFGLADPDAHLGCGYVMNRLDFFEPMIRGRNRCATRSTARSTATRPRATPELARATSAGRSSGSEEPGCEAAQPA